MVVSNLISEDGDRTGLRRLHALVDYKSLVAAIGVIVSLSVLFVLVDDSYRHQEDSAALSRAQVAADKAAANSRTTSTQVLTLTKQLQTQSTQIDDQAGIVSALRTALAKQGYSTIVRNNKVTIVKGPVHTGGLQNAAPVAPSSVALPPVVAPVPARPSAPQSAAPKVVQAKVRAKKPSPGRAKHATKKKNHPSLPRASRSVTVAAERHHGKARKAKHSTAAKHKHRKHQPAPGTRGKGGKSHGRAKA